MNVLCKRNCHNFKKGTYYKIVNIFTIFEPDDFITIEDRDYYRFRLNDSISYIEDYIGTNEYYFYNYFCNIIEERKFKLEHLNQM